MLDLRIQRLEWTGSGDEICNQLRTRTKRKKMRTPNRNSVLLVSIACKNTWRTWRKGITLEYYTQYQLISDTNLTNHNYSFPRIWNKVKISWGPMGSFFIFCFSNYKNDFFVLCVVSVALKKYPPWFWSVGRKAGCDVSLSSASQLGCQHRAINKHTHTRTG